MTGGHHRLADAPPTTSALELQTLFRKGRQEGLSSRSALCLSNIKPPKHGPARYKSREGHYAASMGQTQWLQISLQKAESPTQSDINVNAPVGLRGKAGVLFCEPGKSAIAAESAPPLRPRGLTLGEEGACPNGKVPEGGRGQATGCAKAPEGKGRRPLSPGAPRAKGVRRRRVEFVGCSLTGVPPCPDQVCPRGGRLPSLESCTGRVQPWEALSVLPQEAGSFGGGAPKGQ